MSELNQITPTSTHWGNYRVETEAGKLKDIHYYQDDLEPVAMGKSLIDSLDPGCRIPQPMVRKSYLEKGIKSDGSLRGKEPFVPVSWDKACDLAAEALTRVKTDFGNESIFGGSYGWASAGRFHHAQSQIHRFLNMYGGYTAQVDTYSSAASHRITPRTLGLEHPYIQKQVPSFKDVAENTKLVVAFGGLAIKNTYVNYGGLGSHCAETEMKKAKAAGTRFINISPIRDDLAPSLDAEWWPCRPHSDVAIMLALAYVLITEDLCDTDFLDKYTVGFENFTPYVTGKSDGLAKTPEWASSLSDIPADDIRQLGRQMAADRTFIGVCLSLQRAEHGEQPFWMGIVLAAMLGYHGLPGGGIATGFGSVHNVGIYGRKPRPFKLGAFSQGANPVDKYIPCARITEMLENPGGEIDYDGKLLTFPDIRLIFWAGGNPFHHHQDINRLIKAWAKPETVIVNESVWNPLARHADIVFPATTMLERNDVGSSDIDTWFTPMPRVVEPYADSKSDFEIFTGIAEKLGFADEFTEGRDEMAWVKHIYAVSCEKAEECNIKLPPFEIFWSGEQFDIVDQLVEVELELEKFRRDPEANPLPCTPSGKIEIFSEEIASFGYRDCQGHPMWFEKQEWLGGEIAKQYPLHLISNQPKTRLHSQYDHGRASRDSKIQGREPMRINPQDAAERGLTDGDVVKVFNGRGACLAGVKLSDQLRRGVVELATGAWYDPLDPLVPGSLDVHGNPNVLTQDVGTSKLAQGPSSHSCLVEVEKYLGELPPIKVFDQPPIAS